MSSEELVLPFAIPHVYEGFAKAEGLARLRRDGLVLEFEVQDAIVGMARSGLKEVVIPLQEIDSVDVRQGWLRTTLVVRVKSLRIVEEVPNSRQGRILLRVPFKERRAAERFAATLEGYMTEAALEQLDENGE
jgi:hypothetical protein